jgi:hypothetical protein
MALEATAIFWIGLLFSPDLSVWALVPPLGVYGVGVGLATAQLTNVALAEIPRDESGVASGGTSTLRQVGSALGIAILGTVLAVGLGSGTRDRLAVAFAQMPPQAVAQLPMPPAQLVDVIAGPIESTFGQALPAVLTSPQIPDAARPYLTPVIRSAVEDSFVDGARNASRFATAFVLLGLLLSLFIPNIKEATRAEAEADAAETGGG